MWVTGAYLKGYSCLLIQKIYSISSSQILIKNNHLECTIYYIHSLWLIHGDDTWVSFCHIQIGEQLTILLFSPWQSLCLIFKTIHFPDIIGVFLKNSSSFFFNCVSFFSPHHWILFSSPKYSLPYVHKDRSNMLWIMRKFPVKAVKLQCTTAQSTVTSHKLSIHTVNSFLEWF